MILNNSQTKNPTILVPKCEKAAFDDKKNHESWYLTKVYSYDLKFYLLSERCLANVKVKRLLALF